MSTSTEPRPSERNLPDLDAEREVDLRRHWNALTLRWWLPAAGLAAGIAIGLLVSLGGGQVYTAKATVYLGQPLSPGGSAQIQSQATNPSTVRTIIHSEAALRSAARQAGMPVSKLRGKVSSQAISGSLSKLGQTPLVRITVTGSAPRKIGIAANALARIVIKETSGYVSTKITTLQSQLESYSQSLNAIDRSIDGLRRAASSAGADRGLLLALELTSLTTSRSQVVQSQATAQQLLSVAQTVERGQILGRAVPTKTTARSRRNAVIVAGLIGLLLGLFAALLWEPAARVVRRPA
jgi:uncharacterized protein involved in exopolysaccharide biosynthesis